MGSGDWWRWNLAVQASVREKPVWVRRVALIWGKLAGYLDTGNMALFWESSYRLFDTSELQAAAKGQSVNAKHVYLGMYFDS